MTIKTQALLTGAGFSCNVRGFLGDEFCTRISNHPEIQERAAVMGLLESQDEDYESVYVTVVDDSRFENDREAVVDAYQEVYSDLDLAICRAFQNPFNHPLNLTGLREFLGWFAGTEGQRERGHLITLNQDLFIERLAPDGLGLPGIGNWRIQEWVALADWDEGHGDMPMHALPNQAAVDAIRENDAQGREVPQRLQYIKLHGSMNWVSEAGSPIMVIAGRKREQIEVVPLLAWHLQKFQQVLATEGMHLCVIGYSFRDPHINELLASAISKGTLERISVIGPNKQRDTLTGEIEASAGAFAADINSAVRNGVVFGFDLAQAFPSAPGVGSLDTDEAQRLLRTFGPR